MNKPSWLYLIIFIASAALGVYQALFPVSSGVAFTRYFGLEAFLLLCVSLMLGPLAFIDARFAPLLEPRRAIGLASFALVLAHLLLAASVEFSWQILAMLSQIQILPAVFATLCFTLLALTSSDFVAKTIGMRAWKWIQRLNYAAFIFSFAHFLLEAKGLFAAVDGAVFVNLAEIFAILIGILVALLQIWGFLARKNREAASKAAAGGQIPPA